MHVRDQWSSRSSYRYKNVWWFQVSVYEKIKVLPELFIKGQIEGNKRQTAIVNQNIVSCILSWGQLPSKMI